MNKIDDYLQSPYACNRDDPNFCVPCNEFQGNGVCDSEGDPEHEEAKHDSTKLAVWRSYLIDESMFEAQKRVQGVRAEIRKHLEKILPYMRIERITDAANAVESLDLLLKKAVMSIVESRNLVQRTRRDIVDE